MDQKRACIDAASLGQAERDAGHLLEARERLLFCASDACPSIVRKSCADWLAELEQCIPSIVVQVLDESGHDVIDVQAHLDGAQIRLDGRAIPLDPGQHKLSVIARDGPAIERLIMAVEHQVAHLVSVRVAQVAGTAETLAGPIPVMAPSSSAPVRERNLGVPTGAWVLGGAAIVAAASFSYFALAARHDLDTLKHTCAPRCDDALTQPGRTKALVADVSLGVAAAAFVSAALWALLPTHAQSRALSSAGITPMHDGALWTLSTQF